jgi:hypothetical protein
MMKNPAMMQQMMGAAMGGGQSQAGAGRAPGSASGMPDLSSMLSPEMLASFRNNPQVHIYIHLSNYLSLIIFDFFH